MYYCVLQMFRIKINNIIILDIQSRRHSLDIRKKYFQISELVIFDI